MTGDGRVILGTLAGNDQVQNLILNDAVERVYSSEDDVEEVPLGLYLVRGDNVCLVGEYDVAKLSNDQRAPVPLPAIKQQQF